MIEQVSALKRKIEAGQAEVERLQAIHADLSEQATARSAERGALESELAQVNEQLQAIELDRLVGRKVDEKAASKASALAEELKGRIGAVDVAPVKNSSAVAGLIDQEQAAVAQLKAELAEVTRGHFMALAVDEVKSYANLLKQVESALARVFALHLLTGKGFRISDMDSLAAPRVTIQGMTVEAIATEGASHNYDRRAWDFMQLRDQAKTAEAAFKAQIDAA